MGPLSTLINDIRASEPNTLLVDAGDMFTGSLSKATEGRLVFDLYNAMGYDAVNLGNHEFEYGWKVLHHVMQRAQFPVLNANIFTTTLIYISVSNTPSKTSTAYVSAS